MPPLLLGALRRPTLFPALIAQLQQLKDGFGLALGIIMMIGFMSKFEDEMRLVTKQLPEAKKFLESLSKAEQARIQARVESVDPMFRDHRLVKEVRAHMGRESFKENSRRLMPKPGARVAA